MNERIQKLMETKQRQSAEWAKQVVTIDANWEVRRFDDRNWVLNHKGEFDGYFNSPLNALLSIPRKMLSAQAAGSLVELLATEREILETIQTAAANGFKTFHKAEPESVAAI